MTNILEAQNLNKSYLTDIHNHHAVLKNVNLQIKKGEFVSIMGPSGSGKSTLLYHLSGLDSITSGSVLFNGEDISNFSEKKLAQIRLNKMGFVFQQSHFLKNLTVFDNIVISGYLAKNFNRKYIDLRARELSEKMGITNIGERDISQVSGGQLQRAAICRALINNPDIVFGDEPTGALNSTSANTIMNIFTQINQLGTSILLVTHDTKVAAKAERIIYLLDGKIISEYSLGKYIDNIHYLKEREKKLTNWLEDLQF